MLRRRFHAMGTQVHLVLATPATEAALGAITAAEADVRRLERLLTRFDPGSELSRLNEQGRMAVGPELLDVVELSLAGRERTGGRFDPTVHDALVAAGYDRTFDQVPAASAEPPTLPPRCAGAIRLDRLASTIELGPGVHLDLGGIAKGYAADRAATILAEAGPCLVDVGGDIAVRGGPWPVGVETADRKLTLELSEGALATSGRDRRRWTRGTDELHHIIDPATGRPAAVDLLRVTVAAASAAAAEVLATWLFLAGASEALEQANRDAIPAVLVTRTGRTLLAGGLV